MQHPQPVKHPSVLYSQFQNEQLDHLPYSQTPNYLLSQNQHLQQQASIGPLNEMLDPK